MLKFKALVVAFILLYAGFSVAVAADVFGTPPNPQPYTANPALAHYDVQVHSRDSLAGFDGMYAEHGADCSAPPATHPVTSFADSVFICNNHVMTAINAGGYGMAVITPSQLLDCTVACTVQWAMSTEDTSFRDWPDVWITPWADNLTLPFDMGDVDLQGNPRLAIHIDLGNSQNAPVLKVAVNGQTNQANYPEAMPSINSGIANGTNQAAERQTFRFTLTTSHVRFERLASASASAVVFWDYAISDHSFNRNDLIVQFAHHSYTPSKAGSCGGCKPGTWHWSDFSLSPSKPFTLIEGTRLTKGGTVTFAAPAPAGAMLRFSATCKVSINGKLVNRQRFINHAEHASSYFVPIAQGTQSVNVSFAADGWYSNNVGVGCYAQDFAVWGR